MKIPNILPLGDAAVAVELDDGESGAGGFVPNADVSARVVRLAALLAASNHDGVLDVVPTFRTVGIHFDPVRLDCEAVSELVRAAAAALDQDSLASSSGTLHRLPVCYGGAFGPDLPVVAASTGLSEETIALRHAAATYTVFMLGFLPGFAYLGSIDPSIAVPRHAVPRQRVPRGSVAIAGRQTGVYPADGPGGWNVIGRTPVRPFDPQRTDPFLFKAGDRVQFYPVSADALADES